MQSVIKDVPAHGQIVTVRNRRYIVSEIEGSALPTSIDSPNIHHLITLTSIEDDALGEQLEVIWELEPGSQINEEVSLPTVNGFDSPRRLDAFLDAVRWGAISQADSRTLQAPFRSGVEIKDYQLDPLVRALQMPRVNLLIADDVGLGKTVETGLVIQELIVRNRARTVLIACPAGLQIHWKEQMRDKFGLEFRIINSQTMKNLRRSRGIHVNPWTHFPRLITSIDFIKRERPMRLLREILPNDDEPKYPRKFDILVVDEAHNVAPSGRGKYAIDSLRTQAIRTLAPHFEHTLFLSATPHNGYQESFSALLELLDDQRFARGIQPDNEQLRTIMVRRLKSELKLWDGKTPMFPVRQLQAIEVEYTDEERQVHQWLREYSLLRAENSASDSERLATEFVMKLLKKRLFSSPAAFLATLVKHRHSLEDKNEQIKKRKTTQNIGILRRQIAQIDEDYADDEAYEEATDAVLDAASIKQPVLTHEEVQLLNQMQHWSKTASARRDQKTHRLVAWLHETLKPNGDWNNERVIIFTEYRATQSWLQEVFVAEGLGSAEHLGLIYGGMDDNERERIKAAFQADPEYSPIRILLATDAASEGIDLQNHCHRLIHFEIPWNPNRMEQRNGRIDRYGQTHDPQIYHFVDDRYLSQSEARFQGGDYSFDGDLEFLAMVVRKVEQIREDLGSVGSVIAAQVEEAMQGKRRTLDTSTAEQKAGGARRLLKFERDLQKRVDELRQRLYKTQDDLNLTPDHVHSVVEVALELAEQPPLIPTEQDGIFHLPQLTGTWAASADGLQHPHTREIRPITFDHSLSNEHIVLVHLNHRLVQQALRLLRAEVWSQSSNRNLHRVTARLIPNHVMDTPAVIAHARLVIIGDNSHRLHEQVIAAGGYLRPNFNRMNVGQVEAALVALTPEMPNAKMQQQLLELWPSVQNNLSLALTQRMKTRLDSMEKMLGERRIKERTDIETILTQLADSIQSELNEPSVVQLELFSSAEKDQLERNKDALRHRLTQIPNEIIAEQAAIDARFKDPQSRLFPVSVTFLVPERLNQ